MPKGRSDGAKVGAGEYEYDDASVGILRSLFLLRIAVDVPDAVADLETLLERGRPDSLGLGIEESEEGLGQWALRYHLGDEWVRDVARRTLLEWREDPVLRRHKRWADIIQRGEFVPQPAEPLRWAPTIETEAQFRVRVEEY